MKGRSKARLDIYITVSQLCAINHTAERGKDRVEKRQWTKGEWGGTPLRKCALLDKQRQREPRCVYETEKRKEITEKLCHWRNDRRGKE